MSAAIDLDDFQRQWYEAEKERGRADCRHHNDPEIDACHAYNSGYGEEYALQQQLGAAT